MKEQEIKINSLNLTIGKREISLTIDEARKLKTALDDLFKKEEIHHWTPPIYLERIFQPLPYNPWQPNCTYGDTSGLPKYGLTCDVNKY